MRTVIVTGASRGLGLAIARTLATSGYRVVCVARHESEQLCTAIAETTSGEHAAMHFRALDLTKIDALPDFVKGVRKEFGAIYGLVNNAGIGTAGVLATMRESQIEDLLRLNVMAPMVLTKYAVRSMMTDGGGRIVNISSVVAFTGYSGLSAYSATKAALIGFTRSLAREVGTVGVTVNAIAPGFIDTAMTESLSDLSREKIARRSALKRLPEPDDIAGAALFLLSDAAKNITGTTVTVDAGNTA